jgi:hypothetical protein
MTTAVDNSVGFGFAEMAYILQLQDTKAADRSAAWLRLADEAASRELQRAGLSSLVARGMAHVADGSDVSFAQPVDVVAYTVAKAERWMQLDLLQSAALGDTVVQIESDRTKLLFQPRTMQSWFVLPQDQGLSAEAAQSHVVRRHLESHPSGGVRLRAEGPEGQFELVVRRGTDGWICATVDGDTIGPATDPLTDEALLKWLQSFRSGLALAND